MISRQKTQKKKMKNSERPLKTKSMNYKAKVLNLMMKLQLY